MPRKSEVLTDDDAVQQQLSLSALKFMVASEEQIKRQIEQSRVMLAHQVEWKTMLRAHDTVKCDCMPPKVTSIV